MKAFREIVFTPFGQNVLDYIDRSDLVTSTGERVRLTRYGNGFEVQIGARAPFYTDNNLSASYYLNMNEVGVQE